MSTVREYFLLSDAAATAKRLPEGDRKRLEGLLRRARQQGQAADALWSNGHTAEGLRLAAEAFETSLGAADHLGSALGLGTATPDAQAPGELPSWRAALHDRGLGAADLDDITAVKSGLADRSLPVLDDEVTPDDGETFQRLVRLRNAMEHVLRACGLTPLALMRTRFVRVGWAALLLTGVVTGSVLALWPTTELTARASATYAPRFPPSNVIDGMADTEWLLPNDSTGWVEVELSPPTHIERLRLRNAHNRHHNDRATQDYTIEVYVDGVVARSIEDTWPELLRNPGWTEHAVGLDRVERIRVRVDSHHGDGGGLGELEWE